MKNKKITLAVITILLTLLLALQFASAIIIKDVTADNLYPGGNGVLTIKIENDAGKDIEDVSISLDFTNLPISTVGSSVDSIDEISEDDSDRFTFNMKASNVAKSGDYNIPYVLTYKNNSLPQKGTIGVTVSGNTELEFVPSVDNPIVGQKGKISLKIINKGNGEARFTALQILPNGYTLLSENTVYIGTVNSDDFETATFDVIFNSDQAKLTGILEYKDLNNNKIIKNIDIPLEIYTQQKAIEKGIIAKNNTYIYITFVVVLIVLWFIWRAIRKRIRKKKSLQRESSA